MRKNVTDSFDIDKDRSISSHDVTVYVVVKGLRAFRLEDNLDFNLSLRGHNS